jgi:hypothetical protein
LLDYTAAGRTHPPAVDTTPGRGLRPCRTKTRVVWVEFPAPRAREDGDAIGIDVGIAKLIAASDERAIGGDWRQISTWVRCRCPASKGSGVPALRATTTAIAPSSHCRGSGALPALPLALKTSTE